VQCAPGSVLAHVDAPETPEVRIDVDLAGPTDPPPEGEAIPELPEARLGDLGLRPYAAS
jgi:hypothetical protein